MGVYVILTGEDKQEVAAVPGVLNLKKSNCKNCHRCIRKCPVKSIRFTGHQAHIISDECILCGQCFVVCPQEAKEIIDDRERVGVMLQGEAPVIASFDPSFYACWEIGRTHV